MMEKINRLLFDHFYIPNYMYLNHDTLDKFQIKTLW